jgi:hypothetical protein
MPAIRGFHRFRVEPAAVVGQGEDQFAALVDERDADMRRMSVQHGVVDRFARHHQQVVRHRRADRKGRAAH